MFTINYQKQSLVSSETVIRYWTGRGWTNDFAEAKKYDSYSAAAKEDRKIKVHHIRTRITDHSEE